MVSKRDLRLGNVFEQGIVCKINGRAGAKVHLHGKLRWDKRIKVIESVDVKDLNPVVLTPQILKEWCGFRDVGGGFYACDDYTLLWNGECFLHGVVEIMTLHKLQNLHYVIADKELEIRE